MCTEAIFKKNSGCRPETLFKKRLMHRLFFVKFLKLSGTAVNRTNSDSFEYLETLPIN